MIDLPEFPRPDGSVQEHKAFTEAATNRLVEGNEARLSFSIAFKGTPLGDYFDSLPEEAKEYADRRTAGIILHGFRGGHVLGENRGYDEGYDDAMHATVALG